MKIHCEYAGLQLEALGRDASCTEDMAHATKLADMAGELNRLVPLTEFSFKQAASSWIFKATAKGGQVWKETITDAGIEFDIKGIWPAATATAATGMSSFLSDLCLRSSWQKVTATWQ